MSFSICTILSGGAETIRRLVVASATMRTGEPPGVDDGIGRR